MRLLGLDLGTKTLGVSITDKTCSLVRPLDVIRFQFEEYDVALEKIINVINEYNISEVVLGLPKNMDGSLGFASARSEKFKTILEEKGIKVYLVDERLTTKDAENRIHEMGLNIKNTKSVIDSISACIILESYLKAKENDIRK